MLLLQLVVKNPGTDRPEVLPTHSIGLRMIDRR